MPARFSRLEQRFARGFCYPAEGLGSSDGGLHPCQARISIRQGAPGRQISESSSATSYRIACSQISSCLVAFVCSGCAPFGRRWSVGLTLCNIAALALGLSALLIDGIFPPNMLNIGYYAWFISQACAVLAGLVAPTIHAWQKLQAFGSGGDRRWLSRCAGEERSDEDAETTRIDEP